MTMRAIRRWFWRACRQQSNVAPGLGARFLRLILGIWLGLDFAAGHPLWPTVAILAAVIAVFVFSLRAERRNVPRLSRRLWARSIISAEMVNMKAAGSGRPPGGVRPGPMKVVAVAAARPSRRGVPGRMLAARFVRLQRHSLLPAHRTLPSGGHDLFAPIAVCAVLSHAQKPRNENVRARYPAIASMPAAASASASAATIRITMTG